MNFTDEQKAEIHSIIEPIKDKLFVLINDAATEHEEHPDPSLLFSAITTALVDQLASVIVSACGATGTCLATASNSVFHSLAQSIAGYAAADMAMEIEEVTIQ